jgi:hypothetical protein
MMARKVMGALVAGAMGTTPVLADVYESNVVQQLEAEGFRSISTERTWLGRMRIVAESGDGQREIIINPNNGEVLRDLWLVERRGNEGNVQGEVVAGTGSGQGAAVAASGKDQDDDNGGKSDKSEDRNEDRNEDRDRSWSKSDGGGTETGGGNGGRNGGDSDD